MSIMKNLREFLDRVSGKDSREAEEQVREQRQLETGAAEAGARDLIARYGLESYKWERRPQGRSLPEAVPDEYQVRLGDATRVALKVNKDAFERIVLGERVPTVYEYIFNRNSDAPESEPHEVWCFVGNVRVITEAHYGDGGFMDNVVYPSLVAQTKEQIKNGENPLLPSETPDLSHHYYGDFPPSKNPIHLRLSEASDNKA